MNSQPAFTDSPNRYQDALGPEFYCQLLDANYDLLCKSLILDKPLFAQLLNKCQFNMAMVKQIKTGRVFDRKVQRLIQILKEKINHNTDVMGNFCVCLQNVGQGPLSKHFNFTIKRALEKRISEARSSLHKKPGIFITNPYDEDFGTVKLERIKPAYPAKYRVRKQTPDSRPQKYSFDSNHLQVPVPYNHHRQYNNYVLKPAHYLDVLKPAENHREVPVNVENNRRAILPKGETIHASLVREPYRAYNALALLVRRMDNQAKEIEDIKQQLRRIEINQSVVKRTIGQTIAGSGPAIRPAHLPALSNNFTRYTNMPK